MERKRVTAILTGDRAAKFLTAAKAPTDATVRATMFSAFVRVTVERDLCHYASFRIDKRTAIATRER